MNTVYLTPEDICQARDIICKGELLAIPTETVYGLGGDGLNPQAVAKIFQAKGRPQDNPLILHIPTVEWLERYCIEIPPVAYTLAEHFWPGALTMILHRNPIVPDVVTGGLDTVGMRCPAHEATRQVILAANTPVAAPSANTSGRPSPTTAGHVREDMEGKIAGIMDGGPCTVGVESTIIDLTVIPPRLLRPGGVTLEQLQAVLGEVALDGGLTKQLAPEEAPKAPGMKYRHYAPKAPVTVVRGQERQVVDYIKAHLTANSGVLTFSEFLSEFQGYPTASLGSLGNVMEQANRLFEVLRQFDQMDVTEIWAMSPKLEGMGLAVANRLHKAAGFHIIDLEG